MPLWERQIEEWLAEKPERTAAADFDGFWDETKSLAQSQPLARLPRFSWTYLHTPIVGTSGICCARAGYSGARRFF